MATGGGQLEVAKKRESYRSSTTVSLDDIPEEEREETKRALYEYVFWRAKGDMVLSRDEAESFQEARLTSQEGSEAGGESSNAEVVGRRLAELGDQIDSMYGDHFDDIMELYNDTDQAFNTFSVVLRHVFEWDEAGFPTINAGRVAAILGYCYYLCKKYLAEYLSSYGLLGFLGVLATFLVKFLIKAKFYDWLQRMGGWGQLLEVPAGGLINKFVWNPNFFLIVGVASLAIYAFQYFRGR